MQILLTDYKFFAIFQRTGFFTIFWWFTFLGCTTLPTLDRRGGWLLKMKKENPPVSWVLISTTCSFLNILCISLMLDRMWSISLIVVRQILSQWKKIHIISSILYILSLYNEFLRPKNEAEPSRVVLCRDKNGQRWINPRCCGRRFMWDRPIGECI